VLFEDFAIFLAVPQYIHTMYIQALDLPEDSEVEHKIPLVMPAKKEPQTAFGKRLFALRKTRGLTQVQLAEALGTTQRVISHYETNAELPPSSVIIPLARVLAVSTDELLGLKPARSNGNSSVEKQRLWKRFQKMDALPTKDQRAVIRLINSLAGASHAEAS
jgi:transcriptional regulator with XRE-family HTH domain